MADRLIELGGRPTMSSLTELRSQLWTQESAIAQARLVGHATAVPLMCGRRLNLPRREVKKGYWRMKLGCFNSRVINK